MRIIITTVRFWSTDCKNGSAERMVSIWEYFQRTEDYQAIARSVTGHDPDGGSMPPRGNRTNMGLPVLLEVFSVLKRAASKEFLFT
jgi:hypothetical protein